MFLLGECEFAEKVLKVPSWRWSSLSWSGSAYEFILSDCRIALLCCLFSSCLADALEDCPNVLGKIRSNIGCNPNIVHVLSTMVNFDNWVQVLTHKTRENRHRSVETFCKSLLRNSSASNFDWKHFHWPLVRHLQTVIRLGAVQLAEQRLSCRVLFCMWQSAE